MPEGPVAQLGARFHGMEEVKGSNPFRSTKNKVFMSPESRQIVSNLTDVLVQAAHPKRIILFGSQARGDAVHDSDFDIMVIEEKPADRFAEMVRLNRLIRSFDIAVDLLVVSDETFEYWRETPGNVYYEASIDGQVLYQAT